MTVKGVDVASYQPTDFATSGLDFVFIKATESTSYVNPKQAGQTARARAAGLTTGFYHFLRSGSVTAQAAYFVDKCASLPGDILAADWEDPNVSCANKDAFIREVKRLRPDHRVVLYCNTSYWTTRDTTSYCGDGLWIADPSAPTGKPRIQHPWIFHQYSISGGMDRNVGNFKDRAALRAWAGATGTSTNSTEEDDMPLSDADADKVAARVWTRDMIPAPDTSTTRETNPTWQALSMLRDVVNNARAVKVEQTATTAALQTLATAVASGTGVDPDALMAEVRKAIADAVKSIEVHLDVNDDSPEG